MPDSTINPLASLSEIAASLPRHPSAPTTSLKPAPILIKQRRLSSAGQSRRRHSDATAAALTNAVVSRISAPGTTVLSAGVGIAPTHSRSRSTVSANDEVLASSLPPSTVIEHLKEPPPSIHTLKKKGQVFKCESCAKVYRHPSCLVKHRWEHSPHWHETSKLLLSKHQQVQLLEAAAILSHIAPPNPNAKPASVSSEPSAPAAIPVSGITTRTSAKLAAATAAISSPPLSAATADGAAPRNFEEVAGLSLGTSLPEDRSLWPFFVSGGAVVTSLSNVNGTTQRNAKSEDSDDDVFEEDEDEDEEVEIEVVSIHDPERGDDDKGEDAEEREDSGYASSGGGGLPASESVNENTSNQRALPLSHNAPRSRRARSHSISTSASVSIIHGAGGLFSVPEANSPDDGKMLTRSRSRSTASATAPPLTTTTASSGLGATRPARLSSQAASAPSHGGHHHHRSSSTGYHPYGSYRASTTAAPSSSTGTSLSSAGVNISGRARSHSHSRGVSGGTPSSLTSAVSIPLPPPPVPMLFGGGQRGVAIIDGSGSHHLHPFARGTSSSYGYPHGAGGAGSAIVNSSSVSVSIPRSSIVSNIRSLDEEDESIVDTEDSHTRGGGGAFRAFDLRSVGTSVVSELEELDSERIDGGKRDDDQETVDGSWDGEDDQAGGMAMDMDI